MKTTLWLLSYVSDVGMLVMRSHTEGRERERERERERDDVANSRDKIKHTFEITRGP